MKGRPNRQRRLRWDVAWVGIALVVAVVFVIGLVRDHRTEEEEPTESPTPAAEPQSPEPQPEPAAAAPPAAAELPPGTAAA